MDKTKIILIGADPSLYDTLSRLLSHRGVEVLSERDIRMPIPDVVFGSKPTSIVIDDMVDLLEMRAMLPGMRGSAKSMQFADYRWHECYPTQPPADQIKGPKGPRTKWGKIK